MSDGKSVPLAKYNRIKEKLYICGEEAIAFEEKIDALEKEIKSLQAEMVQLQELNKEASHINSMLTAKLESFEKTGSTKKCKNCKSLLEKIARNSAELTKSITQELFDFADAFK